LEQLNALINEWFPELKGKLEGPLNPLKPDLNPDAAGEGNNGGG